MAKLQEILESQIEILSEKKSADGNVMNVRVNWAESDKRTGNGRIYKKALLQREIEKLQKTVEKRALIGTGDHPLGGFSDIKTASHIVTAMSMDEDGKTWADLKIIPTDRGKNIQTLIKSGATLGVSSRGAGSVDEKTGEVQDDYRLLGIDIVTNPSYEGGVLSQDNIMESVDFEEEKSMPSEALIQSVLDQSFGLRQERGHEETWEEFLEENEAVIRATIISEHSGVSIEEALIHMGENDTLMKLKSEKETKIWTEGEIFMEAKIAGVSPKDFARKLNEHEQRKRVDLESGLSEQVVGNLLGEAVRAGIDVKNLDERKKIFEFAKTQASPSEKTLHEKAKIWQKKALVEGKNYDLDVLEEILRQEEKEIGIEKRRMAIKGQIMREMIASGAYTTKEEAYRHVNRELRKSGLPILDEDGQ